MFQAENASASGMLIVWKRIGGDPKLSGTVVVEGRGSIDIDSCGDGCEFLNLKESSEEAGDPKTNADVRVCADRASFATCTTGSLLGGCNVPVARDICQASCGRCK